VTYSTDSGITAGLSDGETVRDAPDEESSMSMSPSSSKLTTEGTWEVEKSFALGVSWSRICRLLAPYRSRSSSERCGRFVVIVTRLILATTIQGYSYTQRLRFAEEAGCVSPREHVHGASRIKKAQRWRDRWDDGHILYALLPAGGSGRLVAVAMAEYGLWLWRSMEGGCAKLQACDAESISTVSIST
jgi:hypothetical protein